MKTNTETRNITNGDIVYTDDSKGISSKIVVTTENNFLKVYPIVFLIINFMMCKLAFIGNILKIKCGHIFSEVRERLQENFMIPRKPPNIEHNKSNKCILKKVAELFITMSLATSQPIVTHGHENKFIKGLIK